MNNNKVKKNVIFSLIGQSIVILLGLIVPRIVIKNYGSDINGLLGTITQICAYIALLEAGITTASHNALLKPYNDGDIKEINSILSVSQRYFRKVTWIYGLGVLGLAILLPFFIKSNISKEIIFLAILLEGFSGVIGFYYFETYSALLSVDGKSYLNSIVHVVIKLLVYGCKVLFALLGVNILALQGVTFLIGIIRVIFYRRYVKKTYPWIKLSKVEKNYKLKDRNAYVLTEVTGTISYSTDLVVLSIFIGTTSSSVYSVYNMVFASISAVFNSVYFSIVYILGQTFHKDIKKYESLHDLFTSFFVGGITVFMSTAYLLCIPFLRLYTNGFSDQNYIDSSIPIVFCIYHILIWSRYVAGNLTGVAGYAKKTSYIALIEAVVNIVVSVVLVHYFQIIGVLLGSILGLIIKVLWCFYIADKIVLRRSYLKSIFIIGGNFVLFIIVVIINKFCPLQCENYWSLLLKGSICFMIISFLGLIINCCTNNKCWTVLTKMLTR